MPQVRILPGAPRLTARAAAICAWVSYAMAPHGAAPGAINFHATQAGVLDESTRGIAAAFATQAAAALYGATRVACPATDRRDPSRRVAASLCPVRPRRPVTPVSTRVLRPLLFAEQLECSSNDADQQCAPSLEGGDGNGRERVLGGHAEHLHHG